MAVAKKRDSDFAGRLRDACKPFGVFTPAQFARHLKVSPQTAYKWWAGQTPNISARDLFLIQDRLKVRAKWLLYGDLPREIGDYPTIEERRALEIYRAFKPQHEKLRETWLKQGSELLESLYKTPSVALPFPDRRR